MFAHKGNVKQTSDRRPEHSNECIANKHDCLVHRFQKNPCTMAVILPSRLLTSFVTDICWLNNGNTRLPGLCAGEAPDETKNQRIRA